MDGELAEDIFEKKIYIYIYTFALPERGAKEGQKVVQILSCLCHLLASFKGLEVGVAIF